MNQKEYDFIEEIKSTSAMSMLPLWPYKEEPGAEVNNALLQWMADTQSWRLWNWFAMGFGAGIAFLLIILTILKEVK